MKENVEIFALRLVLVRRDCRRNQRLARISHAGLLPSSVEAFNDNENKIKRKIIPEVKLEMVEIPGVASRGQ